MEKQKDNKAKEKAGGVAEFEAKIEKSKKQDKRKVPFIFVKIAVLNVVNVLLIAAIFYFLNALPAQAQKLKSFGVSR
jgi:hypothetical protein